MAKDLLGDLAKAYNTDTNLSGLTKSGKPNLNIGPAGSPKQVLLNSGGGGGGTPPGDDNSGQLPRKPNGNFWAGSDPYISTNSLLTPQQLAAQNELLPLATERLKKQPSFDDIKNETISHYQRNVLPKIHEGFAGSGFAPSSGILMKQLQAGDASLQTQLAGQRAQYELGQQGQNQNLLSSLLGKSQESFYNPGSPGFAKQVASEVVPYAGKMVSKKVVDILGNVISGWATASPAEKHAISEQVEKLSPKEKKEFVSYLEKSGKTSTFFPEFKDTSSTASKALEGAGDVATSAVASGTGKALTGTMGTVAFAAGTTVATAAFLYWIKNQLDKLNETTAFRSADKNAPENAGSAPAGWMESPKSGTTNGVVTFPEKTNDQGNF